MATANPTVKAVLNHLLQNGGVNPRSLRSGTKERSGIEFGAQD